MTSNYVQEQGFAQWNPWGQQVPQEYQQAQPSWHTQQPGYGWPAQQTWNAQQQAWNAQQQAWGVQQPQQQWKAQPSYEEQYAKTQWSNDLESLLAAEEYAPAAIPEAEPEALPAAAQPSKLVNLVLNILTFCFVGFLIIGSTMFAFSNNESKNLFGFRFYNVLTPSMQPFFKPGDMIFVKLTEPSQIKAGDVVTFSPSSKSTAFLTHRVVELLPEEDGKPARMVTKGDYNNAADPPVALSAAIGVHVFTIPFMGKVVDILRSNLIVVCVCFGAIFLLLMVLRSYFAVRKESRDRAAQQPSPSSAGDLPFDIHAFARQTGGTSLQRFAPPAA